MCTNMLGHCLEKEHWLENMESWHLKKKYGMEMGGQNFSGFGTQKVFGLCQLDVYTVILLYLQTT